jgi:glycosyltransferase involved in cell wall biosynthesis
MPQPVMTEPLRILCPTYWYPSYADDTQAIYVHDINRHLVRQGHRVFVVTPGRPGVPERETIDGVEVIRFPFELPESLTYGRVAQSKVTPLARINRIVIMARYLVAQYRHSVIEGRRLGVDIVHGHWAIPTGPALVAAARRLKVPSVITLHGGDVYVNVAEGYDFPTRWYVRPVLAWTLRKASALTAISEDCKTHALRAGAHESSISVVMNGADLRRFSPAAANAPREFGRRMIFACRQLFPRKGIRFLIEAVAKLKPKYPDINLIIAGDGFERPVLEELARSLGIGDRTQFLGWVANKELPRYFRGCAVSVIPSLEEGFGIPAAEAMGCEIPVVATDAGGLPEVVENGVTGYVVPKGDTAALANAIDWLLADDALRMKMGQAGCIRARSRFDWDLSVQKFEAVYARVLNKRGTEGAPFPALQILKTSYEYPPLGGGGAKVVSGIATRLAARGHHVDLVTMGFRGLPARQNIDGVNVHRISKTRLRISTCSSVEMIPYVLFAPLYLIKKCRANRYLLNHTHFIFPGGVVSYMLKRFTGLHYVITAHGSDVPHYNPNRFRMLHRVLRPMWRKIVADADLILCPSQSIEELIKLAAPQARTHIIPNAIDTDKFKPRDKNPRNLLVVTRMFERKGVQYTLRALAQMQGQFDVNIVGDGPYLPTLKSLAKELGVNARFWGHLDNDSKELKDLYETAAIFVFTSEAENFPIVLLEAMIAGAAVITSSGTGCAEVAADSGLLVPVRDPQAIKSALQKLVQNPQLAQKLGVLARERVIAHFSWDRVIDQHLELYGRLGATHGNHAR